MKKQNVTLDDFRELLTNYILIYEGAVVAILLHEFVPSDQAFEYFCRNGQHVGVRWMRH